MRRLYCRRCGSGEKEAVSSDKDLHFVFSSPLCAQRLPRRRSRGWPPSPHTRSRTLTLPRHQGARHQSPQRAPSTLFHCERILIVLNSVYGTNAIPRPFGVRPHMLSSDCSAQFQYIQNDKLDIPLKASTTNSLVTTH